MKVVSLLLILTMSLCAQGRRRGPDNAPKVGEAAPEVAAVTLEESKEIDLSDPEKITVLIFGSHT